MRTFLSVLKNNYFRTVPRIVPLIVVTITTLLSILFAVYVTGLQQIKAHVAVVAPSSSIALPKSSNQLTFDVVSEKPPYSDLVKQKYDAFVSVDKNGKFNIETLHSSSFKNMLLLLLMNPNAKVPSGKALRSTGENIIGFMMMFLLMIAFGNLFAFADDKEQGQLIRIITAPASFFGYLAAHCVYCLSLLIPSFLMLEVLKLCGWNIGFSLSEYAFLIAVLGFLGISFAMLLNTFIKKPDNANMLGNAVIVLTSVLAGSFYSFSKKNVVLDGIAKALPQKEFMSFAGYLQNGNAGQHLGTILYVICFTLVLFLFSYITLKKKYVKKT